MIIVVVGHPTLASSLSQPPLLKSDVDLLQVAALLSSSPAPTANSFSAQSQTEFAAPTASAWPPLADDRIHSPAPPSSSSSPGSITTVSLPFTADPSSEPPDPCRLELPSPTPPTASIAPHPRAVHQRPRHRSSLLLPFVGPSRDAIIRHPIPTKQHLSQPPHRPEQSLATSAAPSSDDPQPSIADLSTTTPTSTIPPLDPPSPPA